MFYVLQKQNILNDKKSKNESYISKKEKNTNNFKLS